MGGRVVVVGDVGGHLDELERELGVLGIDVEAGTIPEDLVVVQVGDLVHKGPNSGGVVALVDRLMKNNPGRWQQLIGNHEARYLGGPRWQTRGELSPAEAAIVRRWWDSGQAQVAVAVQHPTYGQILITHAGLTRGFWISIGAPRDAATAAAKINEMARRHPARAFDYGSMVSRMPPNLACGPVWAHPSEELLASWQNHQMPFSQLRGHAYIFRWEIGSWTVDESSIPGAYVDRVRRHEFVPVGNQWLIGVDPSHGKWSAPSWQPFIIDGGELVVSTEGAEQATRGWGNTGVAPTLQNVIRLRLGWAAETDEGIDPPGIEFA